MFNNLENKLKGSLQIPFKGFMEKSKTRKIFITICFN